MITKTEAERIAAMTNALRPDWPVRQLMTLVLELRSWAVLDLTIGLAYVAMEQNADGTFVSQTPYRVKEHGPWRAITIGPTGPKVTSAPSREPICDHCTLTDPPCQRAQRNTGLDVHPFTPRGWS